MSEKASRHMAPKKPCTHSRLVEDILTADGKSGQLLCLECKAVFPDTASRQ